ncbi:MAG: DUF285 domain-containing protein, partial [Candidatus Lokiarchaeota archaeon]|nr:DUF285 domain-containing protein [Candidatus Lokiarchaeota archaeon]
MLVFLFPSATEDTNGPTVEINSPVNIIYDSPTHLLTITASDNVAVDTIWYNWKGENVTYFSAYYISFDEGLNIINAWANDSAGNKGTTSVTFSIDTTDPIVEIETPVNTIYNNATQLLTISTSDNVAVDTIWYNWNGENFTYTSQDSVTFNEGLNTIHAWVNDSVGHLGTTSETFTIDTTVPIIEINSLVNSTYYFPTQLLNISASDDVAVDTIWYNWNNINVIYSSAHYITFTEGLKTIHVWANDSVGNIGTTPLTFTMDIIDLDLTFVTEWNTSFSGSGGSSSSNQIKLPLELGGIYNFTVNWGDGNNNRILSYNQPEITHTYASEGVYTIEIKGILIGWRFNGGGDKLKLLEIKEWGAMRLGNSGGYFNGCTNLNLTASDTLDLTGTTSLYRAFSGCQSLGATGIMNNWDVSRVTNMYYMFIGANSFNQDISNWDVSRVTNMGGMFYYAPSFNQDISNWEVSSVTSMSFMFHGASLFNQSIGKWNVSNVKQMDRMLAGTTSFNRPIGNWSVSRVTTMAYMFAYASIFNQSIDDWNVSSVTDMTNMFDKAYDFNQPIGNWDVSSVKIMTGLFSDASSFN